MYINIYRERDVYIYIYIIYRDSDYPNLHYPDVG